MGTFKSVTTRSTSKISHLADEMLERVSSLLFQGYDIPEIADILQVRRWEIKNVIRNLRKSWKESSMLVMSELQKIELAKLEVLELQYWKAWRKVKRIAFLDGVQDVIKLRMDILNGYTHLPPPDAADVQAEVDDILRKIMHSEESRP